MSNQGSVAEDKTQLVRVMIVDDNEIVANMLDKFLKQHKFETAVVANGMEALAKAHEFLPDVILLDIDLPVMNGYQVAQALRQEPNAASAMIIAVTGHGNPEDFETSYYAGIDLHLTKPINIRELKEIMLDYRKEFQADSAL